MVSGWRLNSWNRNKSISSKKMYNFQKGGNNELRSTKKGGLRNIGKFSRIEV
jgi:hypothetical protein